MEIVIDKEKIIEDETAVALGNFDGIHLGHKKLIDTMVEMSKAKKLTPSVFTFDCNFNEFKTGTKYSALISQGQKHSLLENLGVRLLYKVKFCEDIKKMSAEEFVKEIIVSKLNAKLIVVGFNFRFAYKAQGDINTLKKLSEKYKFQLKVISPIIKNDEIISSSLIRESVIKGNINKANEFLGRNYSILGEVIRGKGRGAKMGFATANLKCHIDYVSPKNGVYKTLLTYDNKEYKSITNVGQNPTFNDVGFSIETHIIDFNKSIYGETVEVEFIEFLRPEQKFKTIEQLIKQVNSDIKVVRDSVK